MISRRPTIKDVSKLAKVSIKTVSRVVNNDAHLGIETKGAVLEAIKQLNYKPNLTAKNLKVNKTNITGFIIPDFTNQFFGFIFNGIEKLVKAFGYNIIEKS